MSLDIRMAVAADAERLTELARDTFMGAFEERNTPENMQLYCDHAFALPTIEAELADPASTFIWAEHTGIPAGYAKLRRGPAESCVSGEKPVELERIYAKSDLIGAGVGKTLLHTSIKIAQAEGFHTLWLGVWEDNGRALEFYHRQGFIDVGVHDFMLGNARQTDLIMELDLRC
ncbi:MAG: GNAT family N-acetyltransferase [Halieaceae bacterium]